MTIVPLLNTYAGRLAFQRIQVSELDNSFGRARQLDINFPETVLRLRSGASTVATELVRTFRAVGHLRLSLVDGKAVEMMMRVMSDIEYAAVVLDRFCRDMDNTAMLSAAQGPAFPEVEYAIHHAALGLRDVAILIMEGEKTARRSPTAASLRVANFATRLLPRDERERYLAEYLSELDELAQDRSISRRSQLRHALRLLARAPSLRRALRAPVEETWWPIH